MFPADQYQLLDFGNSRKLERFGPYLLDRPAPAARDVDKSTPQLWTQADARFTRGNETAGAWSSTGVAPQWLIRHDRSVFELKLTEFGHIGLFAEQAENWDWIAAQLRHRSRPVRMLNLFAYTGGSTLAAAAVGAEVVHVDAARNVVQWARRNAAHSGLASASIRWIVEDARKFLARERKRGSRYDAVVLDPPSYGHGPKGEVWKIDQHLPELLDACSRLADDRHAFILLTCHSPKWSPKELKRLFKDTAGCGARGQTSVKRLTLQGADSRNLASGYAACWVR